MPKYNGYNHRRPAECVSVEDLENLGSVSEEERELIQEMIVRCFFCARTFIYFFNSRQEDSDM